MAEDTVLARRRKALKLSQAELADMLGISQPEVSRSERDPEPDKRFVLALEAIEHRVRAEAESKRPAKAAA